LSVFSRSIRDKALVVERLDAYLLAHTGTPREPMRLVHGGAVGVDTLAAAWADERGLPQSAMPPDFAC